MILWKKACFNATSIYIYFYTNANSKYIINAKPQELYLVRFLKKMQADKG